MNKELSTAEKIWNFLTQLIAITRAYTQLVQIIWQSGYNVWTLEMAS